MDWNGIDVEKITALLAAVQSRYRGGSREWKALEVADAAVVFMALQALRAKFIRFAQERGRPLPDEQEAYRQFVLKAVSQAPVHKKIRTEWDDLHVVDILRNIQEVARELPSGLAERGALDTAESALRCVDTGAMRERFMAFLQSKNEPTDPEDVHYAKLWDERSSHPPQKDGGGISEDGKTDVEGKR